MIPVTKSFLPELNEYTAYLEKIWRSGWLTNRGELTKDLESKLCAKLGINNLLLVNNGTIALQIALKSLGIQGEIITTPFSYVATTSSIIWEGAKPIFADINPNTFNISPNEIKKKITANTQAILATHVFGNPCEVEEIQKIADEFKLKVIYDAAHAFDVMINNVSLLNFGDISTLSFHATKIFHTIEGGAIVAKDKDIFDKCLYMHNFGHDGPERFHGLGINGKISEFCSAMGLVNLEYFSKIKSNRQSISLLYEKELRGYVKMQEIGKSTEYNFSYFPIVFESEEVLLKVLNCLNENQIFPRRYFYPSLNNLPYLDYQYCPNSESVAKSIICLPLYDSLTLEEAKKITKLIKLFL